DGPQAEARRAGRVWSTFLVRIMAAGKLLPDAIEDLAALPANAPERSAATRILVGLQRALRKKRRRTTGEEEFVMRMLDPWEQAEKNGVKKGRKKGRKEGEVAARASDVLTVLRVRGIVVSDAARERILAETDPARLARWHERAILAASATEVLDARRRA